MRLSLVALTLAGMATAAPAPLVVNDENGQPHVVEATRIGNGRRGIGNIFEHHWGTYDPSKPATDNVDHGTPNGRRSLPSEGNGVNHGTYNGKRSVELDGNGVYHGNANGKRTNIPTDYNNHYSGSQHSRHGNTKRLVTSEQALSDVVEFEGVNHGTYNGKRSVEFEGVNHGTYNGKRSVELAGNGVNHGTYNGKRSVELSGNGFNHGTYNGKRSVELSGNGVDHGTFNGKRSVELSGNGVYHGTANGRRGLAANAKRDPQGFEDLDFSHGETTPRKDLPQSSPPANPAKNH